MAKSRKKRKRNKWTIRFIVFLFIVGLTLYSGYVSYNYILDSQGKFNLEKIQEIKPENGIEIEIPMGSDTTSIAATLKQKGLISNTTFFKLISKLNGYDGTYKSGTHYLEEGVDYNNLPGYEQIMAILSTSPIRKSVTVMIPEGYTFSQIADRLHEAGVVDKDKFYDVAQKEEFDYDFIKDIPEERSPRLEGYLFPDTYEFDAKAGEKAAIDKMLRNFDLKFKEQYKKRAEDINMTLDDIVILSSITEREAKLQEEREIIAGIFYNRLKNSDPTLRRLQSCATVQYILLNRDGEMKETLTEEDTKIEHPYNTYIIEGLPPGPISNPGEDAIISVLYPEENNYLYFVAKGDGGHVFSRTYNEHVNAMNKYGLN